MSNPRSPLRVTVHAIEDYPHPHAIVYRALCGKLLALQSDLPLIDSSIVNAVVTSTNGENWVMMTDAIAPTSSKRITCAACRYVILVAVANHRERIRIKREEKEEREARWAANRARRQEALAEAQKRTATGGVPRTSDNPQRHPPNK